MTTTTDNAKTIDFEVPVGLHQVDYPDLTNPGAAYFRTPEPRDWLGHGMEERHQEFAMSFDEWDLLGRPEALTVSVVATVVDEEPT